MRRGLMAWNREEVPEGVLRQRVARVADALRARSLHCLLAYTDLTRPAAVSALTHFVPYWSNGVLVVSPAKGATFVATLSKRVADWMHSTARFDDLVTTLDLGAGVVQALPQEGGPALRIGVVDLASLPAGVAAAIRKALPAARLEEAGDLLTDALAGEEEALLAGRASAIAQAALQAAAGCAGGDAALLLAAAERAARMAGAEEIQLAIAPDVRVDHRLRRVEGTAPLGDIFALQATVAYKGCWIRCGRTLGSGAGAAWRQADAWFAQALARIAAGEGPAAVLAGVTRQLAGAQPSEWRLEAPVAGLPLAVVDGSGPFTEAGVRGRAPRSLTVRLRLEPGWWFGAAPVLRQGS